MKRMQFRFDSLQMANPMLYCRRPDRSTQRVCSPVTTKSNLTECSRMTDPLQQLSSATGLTLNRRSMILGMGAAALSHLAFGMSSSTLLSRTFSTPRHTTHYLESGPANGPLMIFLHGWPELSLIWRAKIDAFAADGWHCIAPDMRGYRGSSAPHPAMHTPTSKSWRTWRNCMITSAANPQSGSGTIGAVSSPIRWSRMNPSAAAVLC